MLSSLNYNTIIPEVNVFKDELIEYNKISQIKVWISELLVRYS